MKPPIAPYKSKAEKLKRDREWKKFLHQLQSDINYTERRLNLGRKIKK
jgi:hypothetical protein